MVICLLRMLQMLRITITDRITQGSLLRITTTINDSGFMIHDVINIINCLTNADLI